jgi:hypothetical protein
MVGRAAAQSDAKGICFLMLAIDVYRTCTIAQFSSFNRAMLTEAEGVLMADVQVSSINVPLDRAVWEAWLKKNRAADERFDAIFPWYAGSIAAVLVALMMFWTSWPS